jgi:hypothetical protein
MGNRDPWADALRKAVTRWMSFWRSFLLERVTRLSPPWSMPKTWLSSKRDEALDRSVLATRREILLTRMRFFAYLLETPDGPLC